MNVVGLILSDDLLLASQVTGFAHDHGAKVRMVRDRSQLLTLTSELRPKCVFIDLQVAGADGPILIQSLRGLADAPLLIGFGSHVDHETLHAARQAGCDLVLPRSALAAQLPRQIDQWLNGRTVVTEPL